MANEITHAPIQQMRAFATIIVWVSLIAAATCVAESRRPVLRAAPNAVKTGNYVVVLRRNTTTEKLQQLLSKASKHSDDAKIHRYVETVAKALTLKLSPYSLEVVSHKSVFNFQLNLSTIYAVASLA